MQLNHVGLIPDGNRRWARKNHMDYLSAYKITMLKISEFLETTFNEGITTISVYLLSKDNLSRNRDDLYSVLQAETYFVQDILPSFCASHNSKVKWAGNPNSIFHGLGDSLNILCKDTSCFEKTTINLLVGYDPVDEIKFALKKDNEFSMGDLWVQDKVNCIIRTAGGPTLLSNFLPIQSGYAQIYMIDKLFNECTNQDFLDIYRKSSSIEMPLGK